MKQLLINFRDYCYQELLTQKDKQHAEESYQLLFGASLYCYYVAILAVLAIIQWQLRIPVPAVFKDNFLVVLVSALLMHLPFYWLIRWLLRYLSRVPLERNISHRQLITWRWKALLLYGSGLVLVCLVPWGLTELLK